MRLREAWKAFCVLIPELPRPPGAAGEVGLCQRDSKVEKQLDSVVEWNGKYRTVLERRKEGP